MERISRRNMKRVLEVNVDDKGYGGVFAFVMNVMRSIDRDKYILDIAAFEPFEKEKHKEDIRAYGGEVYECQATGNFIFKQLNTCRKFYNLLKKQQYGVMHIHSDVAYKLLLYGIVGKVAGVKNIIVHSHSTGVEGRYRRLKRTLQAIAKPLLSRQQFTRLACSRLAAQWMYTDNIQQQVQIIKNGILLDKFRYNSQKQQEMRERLGIKPVDKVIGTVARFSFPKYPEKLLAVFREVLKKDRNYVLLWIGTGPLMENIKQKAKEWSIEDNIIFYGNTDNVADMYQVMDVFVLTSRFEGLVISAVEAQSAGVMCICSDALSEETKLVSDYKTVSINEYDCVWADKIMEFASSKKKDVTEIIREKGYDIQQTATVLSKLYIMN